MASTMRTTRRRQYARSSGPAPAALVEQLLYDQLLGRSDRTGATAGAARAAARSLLGLASVASNRRHLACAGRAGAQIVAQLGQRDRLPAFLRRIIRSSSGSEVRVVPALVLRHAAV
eukprot:COSAG06_NODE_1073_length_10819_cov_4.311847_8_plen_117_part_00